MAKEPTVSPMKRTRLEKALGGVSRKPPVNVKPPPPPPPPPPGK